MSKCWMIKKITLKLLSSNGTEFIFLIMFFLNRFHNKWNEDWKILGYYSGPQGVINKECKNQ
jgi:hypothetical protein